MFNATLSVLLMFFLPFTRGENLINVNAQVIRTSSFSNQTQTWCVAKPSSDQATLAANIDYSCSQVDCTILQQGCPCFSPDNLINHASVAMNIYYQANGRNHWNCYFGNSGLIVMTDPSYSNCVYE